MSNFNQHSSAYSWIFPTQTGIYSIITNLHVSVTDSSVKLVCSKTKFSGGRMPGRQCQDS